MTERTAAQRAADAAEVIAYRAACERAVGVYVEELIKRTGLEPLAKSTHVHSTLLIDEQRGTVALLRVRFDVGEVVPREQLSELIEAAERAPGTIEEA